MTARAVATAAPKALLAGPGKKRAKRIVIIVREAAKDSQDDLAGRPRRRLFRLPALFGCLVALVFWWFSVTPTLIPRSVGSQVAVSGVCVALGYGIGTLVELVIRRFVDPTRLPHMRFIWGAVGLAWLLVSVLGGVMWLRWQDDQHQLMGMPSVDGAAAFAVVIGSFVVAAVLIMLARAVGLGTAALRRQFDRRLPARFAKAPLFGVAFALTLTLTAVLVWQGVTAVVDSAYADQNDETAPGLVAPTSSAVSGSPSSLVSWDTLGRTGRDFAGGVTTPDELRAFNGPDADVVDPVRTYVGLQSAPTMPARTDLAVRELERAGGFDRKVLVVWVPTGSGWVIEEAAAAIEQMYVGDTAIVAVQYSFLPSLFAVFMKPGIAIEAGTQLVNAVVARWSQLPQDERPKLLLFAKSLGTGGIEAPFAAVDAASSVANMAARVDGALIVGAKQANPIHQQITAARESGSPVWQPVYDAGRTVRFVTRNPSQPELADATGPRIVYLQHPSDPVTFWGLDALWSSPEWMDRPRGYDVPDDARWFPIVSSVQSVADLIDQLKPPPGFGHVFSTDYVNGWAQVLPPEGWTGADTDRLDALLDTKHADDTEP